MPPAKKPTEPLTHYVVYNPFSKFLSANAYQVGATLSFFEWWITVSTQLTAFILIPIYSNPIMFAKDFSNKIFLPPDTKFNRKYLLFVSWCLCGYSFQFIRVSQITLGNSKDEINIIDLQIVSKIVPIFDDKQ